MAVSPPRETMSALNAKCVEEGSRWFPLPSGSTSKSTASAYMEMSSMLDLLARGSLLTGQQWNRSKEENRQTAEKACLGLDQRIPLNHVPLRSCN